MVTAPAAETATPRCDVCGRRARYAFGTAGTRALRCLRHAVFYPRVRRRAARVAAVVGTVLFCINQADVVLSGHLTLLVAFKIALTYAVPFSVSTYSQLGICRLRDGGVAAEGEVRRRVGGRVASGKEPRR